MNNILRNIVAEGTSKTDEILICCEYIVFNTFKKIDNHSLIVGKHYTT